MDSIRESKTKVVHKGERTVSKNKQQSAIDFCEETYPEMMEEYKRIMWEQYETFCKKQRNYGPGNISVGTALETPDDVKLSLTGLWFRMNDKIQRIVNIVNNQVEPNNESLEDSWTDLSNYSIISMLVHRNKWGK